jgi:DNA invertase Pin-like site-specific DNA recombinase
MFVAGREGEVVGIYRDEAVSGADVSRTDYQRLKADGLAGKLDAIVVDDVSRIGRDLPEFSAFLRDLVELDITLYGVADGIDSSTPSAKLVLQVKGIMNEQFLDDLKARIVRGLRGQFLRGYSTGGRIYGYRTNPILDPSGAKDKFGRPKRLGCEILIDDGQAESVRRIFEQRNSGLGYRTIATMLNNERVPSPHAGCGTRRGLWSSSTIRSILSNRKYTGVWEYNKTRWIKKSVSGKRRSLPNPRDQWERYETEKLRIVTDEIFSAVCANVPKKRRSPSGNKKYLLSGLVECAECGSSMDVVNSGRYSCYICRAARSQGPNACTSKRRVSRSAVELGLLSEIRKALLDPEASEILVQEINAKLALHDGVDQSRMTDLRTQEEQLRKQIEGLLDSLEMGTELPSIRGRLEQRESELAQVRIELRRTEALESGMTEITASWLQEKLVGLSSYLSEYHDKVSLIRNDLRRLFPERLKVSSVVRQDGVEFRIRGGLNPFALVLPQNQYQSKIAVQGLEPRTPHGRFRKPFNNR